MTLNYRISFQQTYKKCIPLSIIFFGKRIFQKHKCNATFNCQIGLQTFVSVFSAHIYNTSVSTLIRYVHDPKLEFIEKGIDRIPLKKRYFKQPGFLYKLFFSTQVIHESLLQKEGTRPWWWRCQLPINIIYYGKSC